MSGSEFPDLISAALHGAGISGDDLAFDFEDESSSGNAPDGNFTGVTANGTSSQVGTHMTVSDSSTLLPASGGLLQGATSALNQQPQQQILQVVSAPQRVTAHVINPPHLKGHSTLLQNVRSPVIKTTPQSIRIRTIGSQPTTPVPQGVQSFRIIRAQVSQAQSAGGSNLYSPQTKSVLGQPTSVPLTQTFAQNSSPQVIGTPLSSIPNGTSQEVNVGNKNVGVKKIIHIPSSLGPNLSQGQFIIQAPSGNGMGQSKVVKVTATSGKPVCPEDITKIVNSLPNLKSGSKIIVNTTHGGDSKTIQLVTKPPPRDRHLPMQITTTAVPVSPAMSVLPVPSSQPLTQAHPLIAPAITGSPAASIINPNISCLPFTPLSTQPQLHKVGQVGALSSLSLPTPMSNTIQPVADKVLIPKAGSKASKQPGSASLRQSYSQKDLTKGWNDASFLRKSHSVQNFLQAFTQTPPDEEEIEEEVEELGRAETYAEYKPSKLNFGKKHPDPVVETSSLSSVEPPDIRYQLRILDECVDEDGKLSALQLESITYACQRHNTILPNGERAGYLVGDGAGVGKGRTIAGIIFENYLHRRKRALWLSVSNDLRVDAVRDLRDIGANHIDVFPLNKFKYYSKISSKENNSCKKGVIFATYSSLIGESQAEGKYNTRLKQLLKWLGHDFEGVIVFDECHKAKNLCPTGSSKPTKTGQTVLELQNRLPKARVVYASATGASEPKNMAYMTRLGLWGEGTPFKDFGEFIQAVERRGVGAMELVAMDAKLRGMYIARQLSFHGVTFRIEEIPLEKDFIKVYNLAVEMWVEAREMFQQAAELIDAEHRMKKSMWGQFWSAHQRFFKYLCISSKVSHCVDLARDAVKCGKCVVIGLQSTGESRMVEQVDEAGGDLSDFVSTAKGVFQSLVEKHFPASTRGRALDIIKRVSNHHNHSNSPDFLRKKKENDFLSDMKKGRSDNDSSDPESNDSDSSDIDDIGFISSSSSSSGGDEGHNPFTNGWDSDEDDPWCQKKRKRKESPKKKRKVKRRKKDKKGKQDSDSGDEDANFDRAMAKAGLFSKPPMLNGVDGSAGNWEKASTMKSELLSRIEFLGERLPPNTLDQLIDELGGTDQVAEMTGRKSRVVSTNDGVQFESRSESDVPLEVLNLTEKQRFMDGEKCIAIISEAASSGISLQADRRVINQKRRVHITLELPWSADRAIQQFGRTHRSNQVSAPEYLFLISELAGERRFAATVAKRLESLGALTHGDRRATETRDLSRFNIDNRYGRQALEAIMKSVLDMQQDGLTVPPPSDYPGDFFKDVKGGLIGVGMINIDEKTGIASLEKDFNNISKFLNRILGMKVAVQNALFKYFTETLTAIILEAKRNGRWDMGILDLGSGQEKVRKIETKVFVGNTATNTAKTELSKFAVERGMAWNQAMELWRRCGSLDEGFYCSSQDRNLKKMIILAVIQGKNKKRELMFNVYRPNTGLQNRCETLEEIRKKYKRCLPDVAQPLWEDQYIASETQCSHRYWKGGCRKAATGQGCEFGLRTRFYWVLCGSVLSVWSKVESVLVSLNSSSRMQIIRLRTEDNQRVVGSLIPSNGVIALERVLSQASARTYTEKFNTPFNYQPYIPGASSSNDFDRKVSGSNISKSSTAPNNTPNSIIKTSNYSDIPSAPIIDKNLPNGKPEPVVEEKEKPELLSMPTFVW